MALKAIQFSPFAPKAGLQIGAGAMTGLDQGIQNFAKMRMQKMQMQANSQRQTAYAANQKAQADLRNRQMQDVDFGKVQVAAQLDKMAKNGQVEYDPDSSGKLVAHYTKEALNNMKTPEDIQNAQTRLANMAATAGSLNSNEQKMVLGDQTNQTKQSVAAGNNASSNYRADVYGQTRQGVADSAAAAKMGAAAVYTNTKDLDAQRKNLTDQINNTAKTLNPTSLMSQQLDPEAKAGLQAHLNELQSQYHALGTAPSAPPTPGVGPTAPGSSGGMGATPGPRTLTADQWQSANKGDIVIHGDGTKYQSLGGGNFIPAPQTSSQTPGASPAPQAAPPSAPISVATPPGQ